MQACILTQSLRSLHLCLPESERSLLLPLVEPESTLLLDVLKSANLCTSLPHDSLLELLLLSTGDGGKLLMLVGEERAGIVVLFAVESAEFCREQETKGKHLNSK